MSSTLGAHAAWLQGRSAAFLTFLRASEGWRSSIILAFRLLARASAYGATLKKITTIDLPGAPSKRFDYIGATIQTPTEGT